ncbi:hypothetical protein EYF80_019705 [Liparis tanakae]|uniref:Uncharacterized protein n=1 Tax=Liparis tanakae TaxID=230148 RepID=A0A4Z2HW11_9TELE|nr:hypothetical protein EYF80_019705 [Liparis tanakae]
MCSRVEMYLHMISWVPRQPFATVCCWKAGLTPHSGLRVVALTYSLGGGDAQILCRDSSPCVRQVPFPFLGPEQGELWTESREELPRRDELTGVLIFSAWLLLYFYFFFFFYFYFFFFASSRELRAATGSRPLVPETHFLLLGLGFVQLRFAVIR